MFTGIKMVKAKDNKLQIVSTLRMLRNLIHKMYN